MCKLLRAGMRRYARNPLTWITLAAAVLCGLLSGMHILREYQNELVYFIGLFLCEAVLVSLLIGSEFANGILRNKLICGHTRGRIFSSELILAALASLMLGLGFAVAYAVVLLSQLGTIPTAMLAGMAVSFILLNLSLGIICAFVSCLISKRSVSAVVCLLLVMLMFWLSYELFIALLQPEMVEVDFIIHENGQIEIVKEANPRAIRGWMRTACETVLYLSPFGQTLEMIELSDPYLFACNPDANGYAGMRVGEFGAEQSAMLWSFPLYSLALVAILSAVGYLIFRKKGFQ